MGPNSRAAIVMRQRADSEFQGAVIEELQGIRSVLNRLVGTNALDKETIHERLDRTEERIAFLERPRPT